MATKYEVISFSEKRMKWDIIILSEISQKDKYIISLIYRIHIKYKYIWYEIRRGRIIGVGELMGKTRMKDDREQ